MNLKKKKALAMKVLHAGKKKVIFVEPRLDEIKEAITRQDIKDLYKEGAIILKDIKGRKSTKKEKSRSIGNIRKKINKRKREYVLMTRKLRKYAAEMKAQKKVSMEEFRELRKKIKNREFRNKNQMRDYIGGINKNENAKAKKK